MTDNIGTYVAGPALGKTANDVSEYYRNRFIRLSWIGKILVPLFGGPLSNPKIFASLGASPDYQYAACDAWWRSMWHEDGLERRTREAIAVAVSIANQCVY